MSSQTVARKTPFFLLIPVLLCLGVLQSCNESKIEQGVIVYDLTYPYMDTEGAVGAIIPKEMTIIFKGTKMRTTITSGRLFSLDIISDESDKSLTMYTNMDGLRYRCNYTAEEITQFKESQPTYILKKTDEQDSVAGVFCTKYTVSSEGDTLPPFDAWFTESLTVQDGGWFSSYPNATGHPMVYDINRYGVLTHAEASYFEEKEIADSLFNVEGKWETVDFEKYDEESRKWFELLLIDW